MIEVAGKKYTLTTNRNIIKILYDIVPQLLQIDVNPTKDPEAYGKAMGTLGMLKLMSELDVVFYNMIKVAHPEITKEKSDEILDNFDAEYNNVQDKLLEFAFASVFEEGNPSQLKKNLNW